MPGNHKPRLKALTFGRKPKIFLLILTISVIFPIFSPGQLISVIKDACRKAFQNQPQRLVTPMYSCTIIVSNEVLGKFDFSLNFHFIFHTLNVLLFFFLKNIGFRCLRYFFCPRGRCYRGYNIHRKKSYFVALTLTKHF